MKASWAIRRRGGLLAATTAAGFALLSACSHGGGGGAPKSGGLEVVIESDMTIPRDLDHVSLVATQDGRALLQVDQDLGPGALLIPTAFEIKATGSTSPVTVKAVAYQGGVARVERDAVTPIPDGRDGALRLALNYLCVGMVATQADGTVVPTCPGGLTCVQGTCQTSTVPPAMVPTYDPGSAPGAGGVGGTMAATVADGGAGAACFDVQDCFAPAAAAAVDLTSCTVALPVGADPANLDVALQFPVGGSGVCGISACWVVFSQGTDWTVSGGALQLPPAVCASAAAGRGTVVITTACPAKTEAQPNCGDWSSIMMPVAQPGSPSPLGQSCVGSATQGCGLCGTQARTCTNGTWSGWGPCAGEGVCMPAATQVCDANGTRICGADCQWGACGCPAGQSSCAGTCRPLATDVRNCGGCGNDCTMLPHVAAGGAACVAGKCTYGCDPGYMDCGDLGQGCTVSLASTANCGACGAACGATAQTCAPVAGAGGAGGAGGATRYECSTGCPTTAPTSCSGTCAQLSASNDNCGACGHACPARATCQSGTCACPMGAQVCGNACTDVNSDDANCGTCGNACPNGSMCQNRVCACAGPATQTCGKCGMQSRTCSDRGVWSDWSACVGEGACAAGTSIGCGNGTQTCDNTCKLSECRCQEGFNLCSGQCVVNTDLANCGVCGHKCPMGTTCQAGKCSCPTGSSTQACGNCGMQTRTCDDGTWSAWSACTGAGVCMLGATQSCDTNGTKTCGGSCQWSDCVCNQGYALCSQQCVNEQTDAGNCGACGKSCTGGTTCQSGSCKCPGTMQLCRGTCASNCAVMRSSCFDPNTNLTWAATNAGSVDYATAVATCASFGGSWRLPTYAELQMWPWVSKNDNPGELATVPSPGASTCYVSVGSDPVNYGATPNYIWSSTTYTGDTSCVYKELASIVAYHSLSGPVDGYGCTTQKGPQLLCVE